MIDEALNIRSYPWGEWYLAADTQSPELALAIGSIDTNPLARQWFQSDDTVLDIGAYIGDNTVSLVKWVREVYAFEPFLDAWTCLNHNSPTSRNYHAAVGNGERVALFPDLTRSHGNPGCREVRLDDNGIPTLRIDSLNLARVDVIKVDCEGFEIFALQGMMQTIQRCRPRMLIVECFPGLLANHGQSPQQQEQLLIDLGYKLTMHGSDPRWDWICTRSDL